MTDSELSRRLAPKGSSHPWMTSRGSSDACGSDHGRFLLAFSEMLRPLTVDVGASKLLAVVIIDRGFPVFVSSALVSEFHSTPPPWRELLSSVYSCASTASRKVFRLRAT